MDNSITVCFREKNICIHGIIFFLQKGLLHWASSPWQRSQKLLRGKQKVSSSFSKPLLSYISFPELIPWKKKKSLKVFRTETCFQCHSGKPGTHLLSSEEGLNQSATGDLMKQIIEHGLIQVITYGKAQKISKLLVHWLNY